MRQVKKAQTRMTIEPLIAKELENTIPTHKNGRAMRITKAEAFVKRRSNEPPKRDKVAIGHCRSRLVATFGRTASSQGSFAAPREHEVALFGPYGDKFKQFRSGRLDVRRRAA
jgi:hypothetical protein